MRYHLIQKFFGKMVEIKAMSFFSAKKSSFSANSERPILGLSNEVSFVPEILWKGG